MVRAKQKKQTANADGSVPTVTAADIDRKAAERAADAFVKAHMKFVSAQTTTAARAEAVANPRNFISTAAALITAYGAAPDGKSSMTSRQVCNMDATTNIINNRRTDVDGRLMMIVQGTKPELASQLKTYKAPADAKKKKDGKKVSKEDEMFDLEKLHGVDPFRVQTLVCASASGQLLSTFHILSFDELPEDHEPEFVRMEGVNVSQQV